MGRGTNSYRQEVKSRKKESRMPKEKSLPQRKKNKKACLTTETTYHLVIKLYRCKYTYSSITQQIFLHHQLGTKNPLGHKSVDTDSNSVQKGRIMSLIVYLQGQKTIEYNNSRSKIQITSVIQKLYFLECFHNNPGPK